MCKEAYDDYKRFKRDKEANLTIYRVLGQNGFIDVHSSDLKVGMIVEVNSNMRIPADMILLYTKFIYNHNKNELLINIYVKVTQTDQCSSEQINWMEKQTGNFVHQLN